MSAARPPPSLRSAPCDGEDHLPRRARSSPPGRRGPPCRLSRWHDPGLCEGQRSGLATGWLASPVPMNSPYLLTPGPLTTSATVKEAMLRDWGSRDEAFIAMNRDMRARLLGLVGGEATHVCVPLQGSGTFTVEAVIGTLVPRDAKLLVLVNGAYGTAHGRDRPRHGAVRRGHRVA